MQKFVANANNSSHNYLQRFYNRKFKWFLNSCNFEDKKSPKITLNEYQKANH